MGKISHTWMRFGFNKYIMATVLFGIVIVFLDENNLIRSWQNRYEISRLKAEIRHYREMYEHDTERLNELQTNPEAIEKIAREKYLMKSPNEDVYIFKE